MTDPSAEMREVLTELLPCPFCGRTSAEGLSVYGSDERGAIVECVKPCNAIGPDGDTRADAIARWNRRAILSAQPETWNIPDPCEHGTQPPIRCEHCYPPVSQPSTVEKKS